MRAHEHPHPGLLLRFLQGETSKSENRAIVRHLLRGCRACTAVGRPFWRLLERAAAGQAEVWDAKAKGDLDSMKMPSKNREQGRS